MAQALELLQRAAPYRLLGIEAHLAPGHQDEVGLAGLIGLHVAAGRARSLVVDDAGETRPSRIGELALHASLHLPDRPVEPPAGDADAEDGQAGEQADED